jgi:hypothetical protein
MFLLLVLRYVANYSNRITTPSCPSFSCALHQQHVPFLQNDVYKTYFCSGMIKNFLYFKEISFLGLEHLRDPATIVTNILLFAVGFWCFLKISKFKKSTNEQTRIEARGWSLFFLFGSIAYLTGVVVHGFSWYFAEQTHFYIWLVMGWMQNLAVVFAQFATAKWYLPKQFGWLRIVIVLQFVFFCALMAYIRKFAAVNIDVALALVPIACWNIYLHKKGKLATSLVGWGILFSAFAAVFVVFRIMPSDWFSYNDIAHVILVGSLLMIYAGLVRNFGGVRKTK